MVTVMQKSNSFGNSTTCKWCDKTFTQEKTFLIHTCSGKKRWADRDLKHVRLGFRVYNRFYELTTTSFKPKTQEDFIRSPFYNGFVKFGRSCVNNDYIEVPAFADWLIERGVKLSDWTKDSIYNEFLQCYIRKESGFRALERTIEYLVQWGEETNLPWNTYFLSVTSPRGVHDIRSGKVSPWAIYLSETGKTLMEQFSSEQWEMVWAIMDTNFWMPRFSRDVDQHQAIQKLCKEANL